MIAQMLLIFLWLATAWAVLRHYRVFSRDSLGDAKSSRRLGLIQAGVAFITYAISLPVLVGGVAGVSHRRLGEMPLMWTLAIDGTSRLITTAVMWAMIYHTRHRDRPVSFSLLRLPVGVLWGVAGFLLISPFLFLADVVVSRIGEALRHGPPPNHPLLEALSKHPSSARVAAIMVTASVIAPVAEETFFRGLFQPAVANALAVLLPPPRAEQEFADALPELSYRSAPPLETAPHPRGVTFRWVAIVVTSLFFAGAHIDSGTHNYEVFVPIFMLSVALGYLYERTGNLWANISLHAVFNSVSTILFLCHKP